MRAVFGRGFDYSVLLYHLTYRWEFGLAFFYQCAGKVQDWLDGFYEIILNMYGLSSQIVRKD